jgi:hypothetical protein
MQMMQPGLALVHGKNKKGKAWESTQAPTGKRQIADEA